MDNTYRDTWATYEQAWSTADHARRLQLLDQSVSTQCVYTDPLVQVEGHEALSQYIDAFHQQMPGGQFVTTAFETHHDQCLAAWNMLDGEGAVVNPGHSFARVGADGKLLTMTGFFPIPPGN